MRLVDMDNPNDPDDAPTAMGPWSELLLLLGILGFFAIAMVMIARSGHDSRGSVKVKETAPATSVREERP